MTDVHTSQPREPRKSKFWIALATLILLAIAAIAIFHAIGRWLVVTDPLDHADAIIILSGGMPARALEGAKIYQQGMAPRVWITRPLNPGDALAKMHIPFEGEESYSRAILIYEGVPENAIRILPQIIVSTEEEVRASISEAQSARLTRVILVTSPPHTRRVRTLWRKLAPAGLHAIVRPASTSDYDPDHWWRTTRDALAVERETLGLLNAWAGLPFRPASH